ncbi:hypothetical protein GYB22_10890 [bacterium]|nr:hypothetical protein [bacterium]
MKNRFLLPRKFLPIGIILTAIGAALGIAYLNEWILPFFEINIETQGFDALFKRTNYQGDVAITCLLIGLYILGFTKRKEEDEFIDHLRYQSLLVTLLVQNLVLLITTWIIGGSDYFLVMTLNLFSFLILFNIIFLVRLALLRKNQLA